VDVAPGETVTRNATVRLDEPGAYDLVVSGDRLDGSATVASLAIREPEPGPEGSDDGTGPDDETGADDGAGTRSDGSDPDPTRGTRSDGEESVSDGGASADDAAPSTEPGATNRTEPAAFDPADFAGLAVLVAIVLATLFLVRRAPR
jgi:hypothetical protein